METVTGSIGRGLVVLLGVGQDDTEKDADYLADKVAAGVRYLPRRSRQDEQECSRLRRRASDRFAIYSLR
jgi:D-Tyr-tRNAtyr deacylase